MREYLYVLPTKTGKFWVRTRTSRLSRSDDLVETWKTLRFAGIRIPGMAVAADFICWAWRNGYRVELAGPRVLGIDGALSPSAKIARMMECPVPAAYGGWHVATAGDIATYSLWEKDGWSREAILRHPVMPYLQFIPGLDVMATGALLREILDPRWYICAAQPERVARLQAYLGVMPKHVGATSPRRGAARRWKLVQKALEKSFTYPADMPGNFVTRTKLAHPKEEYGLLRAARRFVLYLHHTWLQALYEAAGGAPNQLFIPEAFFRREEELAAFRLHVAACRPPAMSG